MQRNWKATCYAKGNCPMSVGKFVCLSVTRKHVVNKDWTLKAKAKYWNLKAKAKDSELRTCP